MKIYHATNFGNKIIKEGFKIPKYDINTVGRFGAGIYFGATIEKACEFGAVNSVVTANVDTSKILKFDYIELLNWFPEENLSLEDYEGVIELREYILSKGFLGSHICYDDGDEEIVIYDTSIISNICKYKEEF